MERESRARRLWRDWGLTITLLLIFLIIWFAQSVSGFDVYNQDQLDHGQTPVTFRRYFATSHFWEATSENWESEFLQMFSLVVLTVFLRQKGSPESDDPDQPPGHERAPKKPHIPRAVRRGGIARTLYEHSLSLALLTLFVASFALHVVSGAAEYSDEERLHGRPPVTSAQFLARPQLWFESSQNWQSEFLSSGLLVVLTVYLREKGSSQSKAILESHDSTGEE